MSTPPTLTEKVPFDLPDSFYEMILAGIPARAWANLTKEKPELKDTLLGRFSQRPRKPEKFFSKERVQERLFKLIREDPEFLEVALQLWRKEQGAVISFVGMLNRTFMYDNFDRLRDVIGPERFLACLYVLGHCDQGEMRERLDENFWDRHDGPELLELMAPSMAVTGNFLQVFRDTPWLRGEFPELRQADERELRKAKGALEQELHERDKRLKKSREKLDELKAQNRTLSSELEKIRAENKELRDRLTKLEREFSVRFDRKVAEFRRDWFSRYKTADRIKESDIEGVHKRLDSLLKRANKALKLQNKADEEFGVISGVRRQLMQVQLYLDEIEETYRNSLVVHSEVEKVKKALVAERKRLQSLPGIEKVFDRTPQLLPARDLLEHLCLLKPVPENLPQVSRYEELLNNLKSCGLAQDESVVQEEIRHKKRQIAEVIYHRFRPTEPKDAETIHFENLDDFVASGKSKKYEVYVDGYNVLLNVKGARSLIRDTALAEVRNAFIRAVTQKCRAFGRVVLVFDGWNETKDSVQNMEIVFSDKDRNVTADSIIIDRLRGRNAGNRLLVTRDREIIQATDKAVYALIDPLDFYMFVFDLDFPAARGSM